MRYIKKYYHYDTSDLTGDFRLNLKVIKGGYKAQVVIMYQADMTTLFTGETFYIDSLENNRSNKNWIKLSNVNVTIERNDKSSF